MKWKLIANSYRFDVTSSMVSKKNTMCGLRVVCCGLRVAGCGLWARVVGRGSWVVGRGSWVVGRGSWVVGRGSLVVGCKVVSCAMSFRWFALWLSLLFSSDELTHVWSTLIYPTLSLPLLLSLSLYFSLFIFSINSTFFFIIGQEVGITYSRCKWVEFLLNTSLKE